MEFHNSHHTSPDLSLKQNHKSIDICFQNVLPKRLTSLIFLYPGKNLDQLIGAKQQTNVNHAQEPKFLVPIQDFSSS